MSTTNMTSCNYEMPKPQEEPQCERINECYAWVLTDLEVELAVERLSMGIDHFESV